MDATKLTKGLRDLGRGWYYDEHNGEYMLLVGDRAFYGATRQQAQRNADEAARVRREHAAKSL